MLALLLACAPDVSVVKRAVDADHDDHDTSVDCDDAHADVNPDAPELCDGVDNDCDGVVDDGLEMETWYTDADDDGYGDDASALTTCEPPGDGILTGGDCDDADPGVNPDAIEICDAADIDEDCDTLADDSDDSVTGQGTWFRDADTDTYGDAGNSITACDMSVRYQSGSTRPSSWLPTWTPPQRSTPATRCSTAHRSAP